MLSANFQKTGQLWNRNSKERIQLLLTNIDYICVNVGVVWWHQPFSME